MNKYYLLSKADVQPILWDGKARFDVKPGQRVLTEAEFKAWIDSDDGKTLPPHDPATETVELDVAALKYVKRLSTPDELEEKAKKNERQQLRAVLLALKGGTATPAQIQRALGFALERIL